MKNDHKEKRDREKIEQVGQSRLILNSDHGGAQEKGTFYPIQIWPQKGRNSFSFFSASLAGLKKRSRKSWHGMENRGYPWEKNHQISKSKSPNPLFSNEARSMFVFLLRNPILQLSGSENHTMTKEIRLSVSFKGKVVEVFIYTLFDDIYIYTLFDHILSQKLTNI